MIMILDDEGVFTCSPRRVLSTTLIAHASFVMMCSALLTCSRNPRVHDKHRFNFNISFGIVKSTLDGRDGGSLLCWSIVRGHQLSSVHDDIGRTSSHDTPPSPFLLALNCISSPFAQTPPIVHMISFAVVSENQGCMQIIEDWGVGLDTQPHSLPMHNPNNMLVTNCCPRRTLRPPNSHTASHKLTLAKPPVPNVSCMVNIPSSSGYFTPGVDGSPTCPAVRSK